MNDRKPFERLTGCGHVGSTATTLSLERNINDEITRREVMDMLAW